MSRLVTLILLAAVALSTSACVVVDPGAGTPGHANWCYYHPYRCR